MRVMCLDRRRLLMALWLSVMQCGHAGAEDFIYTVQPGDTLIGIGERWLADPARWRRLVDPNRIGDPNYIEPGREIRIPFPLLKTEPERARIERTQGAVVTGAGVRAVVGDEFGSGSELRTGADSQVTLRLADGSRLTLPASSGVRIERLQRISNTEQRVSRLRIFAGRIEAFIEKLRGRGSRFELDSPVAVIGIRGTDFRAGTDDKGKALRAEVLEGAVDLESAVLPKAAAVKVETGFGALADETGKLSAPVQLPARPDLAALPGMFDRPLVRFQLKPLQGVRAHRVRLASDSDFNQVLRDELVSGAEVRFVDLPDSQYHLRVRAVDALGLEGLDAQHSFRLKARPEPPITSAPADRGKLRATRAEFAWTAASGAATYHFQLSRDEQFSELVSDTRTESTSRAVDDLKPGEYFWRVASVRADGDHGPFGDARRFSLFPPPATPEPPAERGDALIFSWSGEPKQTFEFQLARDPQFKDLVIDRKVGEPTIAIARPGAGRYFIRIRATDADGFVGPYTATQTFELHNCLVSAATGRCVESSEPGQKWRMR